MVDFMQVLYIYDLNAKDKVKFNRLKRKFYYHLNKLPIKNDSWKTKSTLAVPLKMEKMLDAFFKVFKSSVIVYKAYTESIEEL